MTSGLLDGAAVSSLLAELADTLDLDGPQHTMIIGGGSLLAWRGLRLTTEDVDSVRRLDDELRDAVARVAARHGLSERWLNDDAAPFLPATFESERCDVLLDHPRLHVLGASLRDVFLMKMYRADPNGDSAVLTAEG